MAKKDSGYYKSTDYDYNSHYVSVGTQPTSANANLTAARKEQLAAAGKKGTLPVAAKTGVKTGVMPTAGGPVYIEDGSWDPNGDQSRLLPQGLLPLNRPPTILGGGIVPPIPATVDERLKARSDAANRAWMLAQARNKALGIPVPVSMANARGGGEKASAPAVQTVKTSTGKTAVVGSVHEIGGYLYGVNADGTMTKVGKTTGNKAGNAGGTTNAMGVKIGTKGVFGGSDVGSGVASSTNPAGI
jgi:hypothetical protein